MIKWLLVLLVIIVVGSLLFGRSGRREPGPDPGRGKPRRQPGDAVTMLRCAHCGVHLPQDDALRDAADRAYCSDPHRIAGPR